MRDILGTLTAVASLLGGEGIGTIGTDLFIQHLPETPRNAVVVAGTGGVIFEGDPTRRIAFTVQCRHAKAADGLRNAQAIHNILEGHATQLPGGFPGRIIGQAEAGLSFRDDAGNFIYPLNYVLTTTSRC